MARLWYEKARDLGSTEAAVRLEKLRVMQANGSLPVIPLYLPVPPVMIWVPQFISGCDLSRSRVSKVEKIWSPSVSVNTQAPSMYFLSPDATLSAAHRADILSSIFSPFIF